MLKNRGKKNKRPEVLLWKRILLNKVASGPLVKFKEISRAYDHYIIFNSLHFKSFLDLTFNQRYL